MHRPRDGPKRRARELSPDCRATPVDPLQVLLRRDGSQLFERICELPEYYQTRTERALLERDAALAERTGADELVELGSGAAIKTRLLLDALRARAARLYVPLDVGEATLRRVFGRARPRLPRARVHGVVGDFMATWRRSPPAGGGW